MVVNAKVVRRITVLDVHAVPFVFNPHAFTCIYVARSRSGHQVAVVPQISSEEHITVVDDVGEASSEDDLGNLVVDVGESSEDDIDPALATPEKGEEALNDPEEQEGVVTSEPALRESDERLEELRELGIQDDCETSEDEGVVQGNNNAVNDEFEAERLARLDNAERPRFGGQRRPETRGQRRPLEQQINNNPGSDNQNEYDIYDFDSDNVGVRTVYQRQN